MLGGASIASFTRDLPMSTTVIVMSSPIRIFSPSFRVSTNILKSSMLSIDRLDRTSR